MADPEGTHHNVRLGLEIDGRKYGVSINPLKATTKAQQIALSDELTVILRNTVDQHFGRGMTPIN